MGRLVLLTGAALALAACSAGEVEQRLGHQELPCAACHQGPLAGRDLASVPSATCGTSDCHGAGGPSFIELSSAAFDHRDHGPTDDFAIGCAGCHRHVEGTEPIEAGAATCGLCHQAELAGPQAEGCRVCHVDLSHQGVTSQGLVIPHEGFSSIGRGCLRCHFGVTEPIQETRVERCTECHQDTEAIQREGIGVDLHPDHVAVSCESCHETDQHHIEEMSSSVALVCSDCHTVEHEVEVGSHWLTSTTCLDCHAESHQEQQALVLGVEPSGGRPRPSEHFTAGLTCGSCHVDGSGTLALSEDETVESCASCHRAEYEVVGRWWIEGTRDRLALVEPYVASAERVVARLPDGDSNRARLATARDRLDLVSIGGGEHNIRLVHQIFEEVVRTASDALQAAGEAADGAPALGRAPSSGFCSYCHYHVDPTSITEEMPEDFHREVMR